MNEDEWVDVTPATAAHADEWVDVAPQTPKESVAVDPPKQEDSTVYLPDFNMNVGIPKHLSSEEMHNQIYEQIFAQKYPDPEKDKPAPQGEMAQTGKDINFGEDITDRGNQLLAKNELSDLVPKDQFSQTETQAMNTPLAVTSGFRQVAADMLEKPSWAIFEGALRAAKAIYKYAPDSSTDYEIKMSEKEKTIGRLNKWIEYYSQPEKYGAITPQVEEDRRLTAKFVRRNYAFAMVNSLADASLTLASFFGSIGMAEQASRLGKAPEAVKYTGKATEALKLSAKHAVTVMAPYAALTTKGDFSARMHSAVVLSAFSMVNPVVALTGWNRVNASMLAILINSAITAPDVKEMYKQSGGANKDFFLLLAPLIAQNVAFGLFLQRTPEAQRKAIKERRIKNIAEDYGVSKKTAEDMIKATEKVLADEAKFAAKAEKDGLPSDVQPYAIDINPIDYNIPKKVDASGKERSKQVYPEFQNDRTIEGLDAVAAELSKMESSRFSPNRDAAGEVTGRVQTQGYSPEHLRVLEPKRVRKKAKSDLDIIQDAIAGKPMTKKAHNRVVDFLELQQAHDQEMWRDEENAIRQERSASEAISGGKSEEAVRATIEKAQKDEEAASGESDRVAEAPKHEEPKAESENRGDTVSGFATDTIEKTPAFKEAADQAQKEGLLDLSRYFKSDMKVQKELSQDLASRNPDLLMHIAMGGEVPPSEKGLLPVSAYLELLNQAKETGDGKLGLELMRSPIADQISQAGSTLSSVSHLLTRDGVDPVSTIKNIEKALEKTGAKKNATQAERSKARQEQELRMKLFEERAIKAEQALERLKAEKASRRALTGGEYGSRNKLVTKERAETLKQEIRSQLQSLNANPIELYAKMAEFGAYHVEAGLREFKTWSEQMVKDLGDKVKPHLATIWNDINDKIQEDKLAKAMAKIGEAYDNGEDAYVSDALKKINEFVQASGVKGQDNILKTVTELAHEVAPSLTKEDIRDAISGYGKYKPLDPAPLKKQIRDINGQWQQIAKIEALLKKQAPQKTGVERRVPSDEERALIKQVEELKKQTGIQVRDPATQLKSALDAVKTRLKNQIKDMDAQIEAGKKIVPEKRSLQYDAEASALVAARDALKVEFDKVFSTEMTPEKRIELATKAAERAVAEYERRIKENDLSPVKQKSGAWSPEISKLKARAQVLRDQIEAMKEAANPSKTPVQKAIDAMKKRLIKQAETYDVKLQNLDFSKKEKKEFVYDDEVRKLKEEADRARRAFIDVKKAAATVTPDQAQEIFRLSKVVKDLYDKIPKGSPEDSPENLAYGMAKFDYIAYADSIRHESEKIQPSDWRNKPLQSVGKVLYQVPGVMKAVNASMDMGHVFRQGFPMLVNNPKIWGVNALRSIEAAIKTIGGYEMMRQHKAKMYSRENYKNGVYAEHGLDLGKEENFISSIAEKAPLGLGKLVEASDVAYTVFLQGMRADYFDAVYKKLKSAGESTDGLGIVANSITGRGSFGENEAAANVANMAFFSIRNLKSRFDQLTGHLADYAAGNISGSVAKEAMMNTVRSYIAMAASIALAKVIANATGHSDDVETDARSSGFGKIRIWNTDIDLTGGMSSLMTLVSRVRGIKDRPTGIVSDVFSEDRVAKNFGSIIGDFFNGKLAPFARLVFDVSKNMTDFSGEKLTAGSVASRFAPITPADVVNAFKGYNADGMTGKGLAKTLVAANIAFWGAGGSSNFPTPKQVVNAAKHVDSEIKRLNKNGEPEKAAALQERTQALTLAGSALEDSQNQINDLKRQIADARAFVQTDKETKKAQIGPLQEQIDSIQQVMDQTLKSIQQD